MRNGLEDGRGQSDTVPIHGGAPLHCFEKTVDTYYAIRIAPIYLCVLLLCRLVLSHFLCTTVAAIHGGTVEDTFSFEKPVHPQRQGHLDKDTYGSYLSEDKIYLTANCSESIYIQFTPTTARMLYTQLWFQCD